MVVDMHLYVSLNGRNINSIMVGNGHPYICCLSTGCRIQKSLPKWFAVQAETPKASPGSRRQPAPVEPLGCFSNLGTLEVVGFP